MFTICNNACHEENVYNLIKKSGCEDCKPPMHVSRYACMVRKQAQCSKQGCSRTMGPPVVGLCPPEKFLRKHSRAPISIIPPAVPQVRIFPVPVDTGENVKDLMAEVKFAEEGRLMGTQDQGEDEKTSRNASCPQVGSRGGCGPQQGSSHGAGGDCGENLEECTAEVYVDVVQPVAEGATNAGAPQQQSPPPLCFKPKTQRLCCNSEKPPIPPTCCSRLAVIPRGCKDYIKDNALKVMRQPAKIPDARYVDQPKGTAHDWVPSGYPRRYVRRQDYGMVPGYLVQRRSELQQKLEQERWASEQGQRDAREKCRHLDEVDRQALLCGLKTNWETTYNEFQTLPLLLDNPGQIRHKQELEQQMKDIEKDIQLLERHNHIFLADASRTFYMA